jgi:hypothetical protein
MTEEQNLPEVQPKDKDSIVPSEMAPWKMELGKVLWAWIVGGASLGSLVTLLNSTDLPKIALGAAAGGGLTGVGAIGYALLGPTGKKMKKGADVLGAGVAELAEDKAQGIADRVLGVDDRYLKLQKEDCQALLCDGIAQVFTPLLEEMVVPLSMTFTARNASLEPLGDEGFEEERADIVSLSGRSLNDQDPVIWKYLKNAEKSTTQGSPYRRMAILAWGGYGKTTLLRHIAYIYSSKQQGKYKVKAKVPVFLALKTYGKWVVNEPSLTLPDLIMKHHVPYLSRDLTLPEGWAAEKLKAGEMVLLLDGFDEVQESIRPQVAKWLKRELKEYPQSIAILTARPKAYDEQPIGSKLEMMMRIWVEPFNAAQQEDFVKRWYRYQEIYRNNGRMTSDVTRRAEEKAAKLLGQIRERSEISDLAKIPLLLNMMVTFHGASPNVQLPKRRVELYQKICELQLRDRPGAKELDTLLIETDAQTILQRLALEMVLNDREKTIDYQTLLDRFSRYLKEENEMVDGTEFLKEVVRVSELLIEKEANEYEFAHWSFQEYLAAKELFDDRKREQEIIDRLSVPEWKPLILMYCSLLKNPSSLIRAMLDQELTDLARLCLQETTKKVDLAIEKDLEYLSYKLADSTYAQLKALLKAGKWEEADQETGRLMLEVTGQTERGFLRPDDLEKFPCEDLLTIDNLWVTASNGHFGFSVQKKIWEQCGSPMNSGKKWDRFCVEVGWKNLDAKAYVSYSELKKNPTLSPDGELPRIEKATFGGMRYIIEGKNVVLLFSRSDL